MTHFSPVGKLEVHRRLSSGEQIAVGTLAQNARMVFFQYDSDYLRNFANISPFALRFDNSLQQASDGPHRGLHGVFADSLPDGWGLLFGSTTKQPGLEPWLVKFTSSTLALGHEEGLCEAAYLTLARHAGIDTPAWQLIPAPASSGARAWLALERFDCTQAGGRYHLHSLCGLLDADFRMPSMDYEDLIKASSLLCKSPAVGQMLFRRSVFNLLASNQDDHTKNWAFLQDDEGAWQPAPFYDVTFSPNSRGEHCTAFCGYGKSPPLKAMQQLARHAGFANWRNAQTVIREVADVLTGWDRISRDLGVGKADRRLIAHQLNTTCQQNGHLLASSQ